VVFKRKQYNVPSATQVPHPGTYFWKNLLQRNEKGVATLKRKRLSYQNAAQPRQ
jgi:hypothetical protein